MSVHVLNSKVFDYVEITSQEIQALIDLWSQHIQPATAIFIRTPKHSKSIFVGGKKSPFSREDPRLRPIPFPTRRPTLREVKEVHSKLATVYVRSLPAPSGDSNDGERRIITEASKEEVRPETVEEEEEEEKVPPEDFVSEQEKAPAEGRQRKKRQKPKKKSNAAVREGMYFSLLTYVRPCHHSHPDIPTDAKELLRVCGEGSVDTLADLLAGMGLRPIHTDPPQPQGGWGETDSSHSLEVLNRLWHGQTALHLAAERGQVEVVHLLMQYGANPAIRYRTVSLVPR